LERHGLSSPTPSAHCTPTSELSPMAFLVGVTFVADAAGHPHPMRPATWIGRCVRGQGRRWPIQIADASPSPLVRVEGAAFDTGGGAARGVRALSHIVVVGLIVLVCQLESAFLNGIERGSDGSPLISLSRHHQTLVPNERATEPRPPRFCRTHPRNRSAQTHTGAAQAHGHARFQ